VRKKSNGIFYFGRRSLTAFSILLILLPAALQNRASSGRILTLSEALRITSEKSIEAQEAKYDTNIAKADSKGVKSLYYPEINVTGGHVNLDSDPAFKFGPMIFPAGEQVYWKHSISAREILWDGGRRADALNASRTKEKAVALGGEEAVYRAQAGVVAKYVSALAARVSEGVVEKRRIALSEHLKIVKDLYEEGVVARNDLLRTEVALRSVEDQARKIQNSYRNALEQLNQAMGLDPQTETPLPATLPPPPSFSLKADECVKAAMDGNPGVKAAEAKVEALKDKVSLNKKAYYPSLIAEAGHSYEQNRYMVHPHVNSLFVGVAWNVFDGGKRASKIQAARFELDKASRQLTEARRTVKALALNQYRNYLEALDETKTARLNVEAAEENFRIVEDQYKAGLLKTTDVLDAESVLADSRFKEATAYYTAYARQAILLAVMGRDLENFYSTTGVNLQPESEPTGKSAGGK